MTVATRDAVTSAAFGVPETESQRSKKEPAAAAVDHVRDFLRKGKEPGRALQGLSSTVAQGKVHGR
jgi:hypothetical protein